MSHNMEYFIGVYVRNVLLHNKYQKRDLTYIISLKAFNLANQNLAPNYKAIYTMRA